MIGIAAVQHALHNRTGYSGTKIYISQLDVVQCLYEIGRGPGELVAGDVIAVEPGLYRHGYGGCRLEDLVLVTDDGAEVLTDYPYDLAP